MKPETDAVLRLNLLTAVSRHYKLALEGVEHSYTELQSFDLLLSAIYLAQETGITQQQAVDRVLQYGKQYAVAKRKVALK